MSKQCWPLDHDLFIRSAADTIGRLRNHACIALWCGGNEQTPAADMDAALQIMLPRRPTQSARECEHVLADRGGRDSSSRSARPARSGQESPLTCLDASRAYVSGSLWSGFGEGHGAFSDGPYGCQSPAAFFDPAFYPYAFNPEVRWPSSGVMPFVCLASTSAQAQSICRCSPCHSTLHGCRRAVDWSGLSSPGLGWSKLPDCSLFTLMHKWGPCLPGWVSGSARV